jgi:hypothetical protein
VVESLHITEPQCLELVNPQAYLLEPRHRHASGLEVSDGRDRSDKTRYFWSWQDFFILLMGSSRFLFY